MKAQADVIFLIAVFLGLAVAFVILMYVYSSITSALNPMINPHNQSKTITTTFSKTNNALDVYGYGLAFIYFAIGIAAIVGAFFVDTNPLFFVAFMFALLIEIMLAAIGHNVFFAIANAIPGVSATAEAVPVIFYIFAYYPMFTFIIALAIAIMLYAK
ncbi:MAG: hypothetical protein ACP5JY_03010, partial [Candidatus Nanoarchaeia archaeon]